MRRLLFTLLTIFVLLTQFGLLAHAYQDHDSNESCHLCLPSSQLGHALTSSPVSLSVAGTFIQHAILPQQTTEQQAVRYYAVRAPPRFL